MRVRVGEGLAPSVGRMVERIVAELGPGGGASAGTLAIGADDRSARGRRAAAARRGAGGRAAADALGPRPRRDSRRRHPARSSGAHRLAGALDGRPVLVAGLARPDRAAPAGGLDAGSAPRGSGARRGGGIADRESAGVAWISGRGLGPAADALEA